MVDHERIWLQHPDDVDPSVGRLWCEDKVWPDHEDDKEPIEYVRADLYSTLSARVAQLEEALGAIEQYVAAERDRYYGLIDAGKGEHGKEGYVRDATWSTWCAKHSLAEAILYVIETTRRRALQEQGGGEW